MRNISMSHNGLRQGSAPVSRTHTNRAYSPMPRTPFSAETSRALPKVPCLLRHQREASHSVTAISRTSAARAGTDISQVSESSQESSIGTSPGPPLFPEKAHQHCDDDEQDPDDDADQCSRVLCWGSLGIPALAGPVRSLVRVVLTINRLPSSPLSHRGVQRLQERRERRRSFLIRLAGAGTHVVRIGLVRRDLMRQHELDLLAGPRWRGIVDNRTIVVRPVMVISRVDRPFFLVEFHSCHLLCHAGSLVSKQYCFLILARCGFLVMWSTDT